MSWNRTNAVMVLAPNAHSKGNGTVAANTGNAPSYPDETYQNISRNNMDVGYGFVPNNRDGYENFGGGSDYIATQYPVVLAGTSTNLTIEMKCDFKLSAGSFLCGLSDGTPQFFLYTYTNGSLLARFVVTSTFEAFTNVGAVSAAGDHSVTLKVTNGLMAIYVDGVDSGGVGYNTQDTIDESTTYTAKLRIGSRSGGSGFDSKLYWNAVYEEAISNTRIVANHGLGNDMGLIGNVMISNTLILEDSFSNPGGYPPSIFYS